MNELPGKERPVPADRAKQPWLVWVGSLGPLGFMPASGTVTVAVAGIPMFYAAQAWPMAYRTLATLAFTAAAVWVHQAGDRILGEKDSRKLVWDELAGYFVAVALLPFSWTIAVAAFVIERAFDILKVPPAHWIERTWPGGFGVVGDDVVAGLYTYAILYGATRWAPDWIAAVP